MIVLLVLLLVVAVITTTVVAARVVGAQRETEAGIQHHRGLALAASKTLHQSLQRLLREPVSDRPTLGLPWADGPQLGPGGQDIYAQGAPTVRTVLLRSSPTAVVARMVVNSDGYTSTLVHAEWSGAQGTGSDSCSYTTLPSRWGGTNTADACDQVIARVPAPAN